MGLQRRTITVAIGLAAFACVPPPFATAGDPGVRCRAAKAQAAVRKAGSLVAALGENVAMNPDPKLGANLSKARSKFRRAFSEAESRGGCETNGDVDAIEARVDAFVIEVMRKDESVPSQGGAQGMRGLVGPGRPRGSRGAAASD